MDTLQPWFQGADAIGWRAITDETVHKVFYSLIIFAEVFAGIFFCVGSLLMFRRFMCGQGMYTLGKSMVLLGGVVATAVWYFGFCSVGSEWFAMWTSKEWNGQMKAYAFSTFILVSMAYVMMPEPKDE